MTSTSLNDITNMDQPCSPIFAALRARHVYLATAGTIVLTGLSSPRMRKLARTLVKAIMFSSWRDTLFFFPRVHIIGTVGVGLLILSEHRVVICFLWFGSASSHIFLPSENGVYSW